MDTSSTFLTGGGIVGIITACVYVGRLVLDWWHEKRLPIPVRRSPVVADAAAASALLLTALKEERAEVQRLSKRVKTLEEQNGALYEQLRRQRATYETEIEELRLQMRNLSSRLERFQTRLDVDLPEPE